MAATLSSSGTFTGLNTVLTDLADTALPPNVTVSIHHSDLESVPDEIRQMIQIFQDGWGAQLGANKRLDFWVTVQMLQLFLQVYRQGGVPRSGDRVS